ncbi:hypothetical protein GCM10022210_25640 [Mucilaginibacter dorajii]|uniref:Uncharacterized protein n=2 Tax=Mucilaginibacter dorajii TaxID=692994 RepID=A0ABP7PZX2_9SPHI
MQAQGDPPTVKPGLEIHRDSLIKIIAEAADELSFKQATDIKKLPNYIATNANQSNVQLVGQPEELILAKWMFNFNADTIINEAELAKVAWFALAMGGKNGAYWFISNLEKIKNNMNKDFTQTMIFNYNRNGTLKYIKKSKTLILVFNPPVL